MNRRRGAGRRTLILLTTVAALFVLGIFAFRGLGGEDDAPLDTRGVVVPDADGRNALLEVAPSSGKRLVGAGSILSPGGLPIPVGVRLSGPGRLEGRVVERGSGKGVAHARTDLLSVPPAGRDLLQNIFSLAKFGSQAQERTEPVAVVASAPDGGFVFEGVRTGRYFLEARSAWHVPDSLREVTVAASGAGGPVMAVVRPGGRIVGVLQHPEGRPVAGAKVSVAPGPGTILTRLRGGDLRMFETTTAADGSFLLAGVPPGEGWEAAASSRDITLSHRTGIAVEAGKDTAVVLALRQGGTVQGRVVSLVEDEEGRAQRRPLVGAHLGVVPRGLRDLQFAEEIFATTHATSGGDGGYTIHNCPPGELDVVAFAEGHLPASSSLVRVAEGGVARIDDLVLRPGPMVRARITGTDGAPLSGVRASWWVTDFDDMEFGFSFTPLLLQGVEGLEYPVSNQEGELFAGPFPGRAPYRVIFTKGGYGMVIHPWKPGEEGDEIEVTMEAGGSVEGIVMDAARAEPVGAFTIGSPDRLESDPGAPRAFIPFSGGLLIENEGGRFRVDSIRPGETTLTFSSPGYLLETVSDIVVKEGETTRGIIVQLQAGGTIRGRVVDSHGTAVSGA